MSEQNKAVLLCGMTGGLALWAASAVQAAAILPTVYASSNWRNAGATINNIENDGRGDTGNGAGTTVNGSYITYDFGSKINFSDVSVTAWTDGTGAGWANNFLIQIQPDDNPNAADNTWVTVGTASNIYGSDANSSNLQRNLARRLYFPEQNHQYFRFVNQNPAGPYSLWLAELQIQRPVVVAAQSYSGSAFAAAINNTTDGQLNTIAIASDATSGSLVLDVLRQPGMGVSGLTLWSSSGDWDTYNLPKNVHVYYSPSDDMNDLSTLVVDQTLSITLDKNANNAATIDFGQSIDARYFKLVWDDIQLINNGANTKIAEIGATYAAVPEPGTLGLFGGAALLMLRRRKQA